MVRDTGIIFNLIQNYLLFDGKNTREIDSVAGARLRHCKAGRWDD